MPNIFYETYLRMEEMEKPHPHMNPAPLKEAEILSDESVGYKKMVLRLRWITIIVTSYLILFGRGISSPQILPSLVILSYLLSNVAAMFIPPSYFLKTSFSYAMLLLDTLVVSLGIYLTSQFNTDFYLAYFLIIFFASIARSFKLLVINALVVCGVYSWFLWMKGIGIEDLERGILLRIPFIFIISLFYGVLIQSFEKKTRRIKKELKDLKTSEQQYRQIVEGAHDAVAILDEKGKIKFFNLRLLQLTQYRPEELTRIHITKLLDGSGSEFIEDFMGRIHSGREPALQEIDIYRSNGERRRVEVSAAQFFLPDQKTHTIIYFKDITDRAQGKGNLIRSENLRTPGGMKTGVSQDANNVLEAILSEVLLTKLGGMGKDGKGKDLPEENLQKELGIIEILLKSMNEIPDEEESLRLKKELKGNVKADN